MISLRYFERGAGRDSRSAGAAAINELVADAYRDHAAAIHGTALRSTRDPDIAADVTQEAYIRLLGEAQAGRFPKNVRAWLFRTSANLIVSRARRASVARRLAPRLLDWTGPAQPDEIVLDREDRRTLARALARLTTTDRMVLMLAANGLTGAELASALDRSPGATRTLLCRARIRLRAAVLELETQAPAPSPAFGGLSVGSRA
ncbi:MAG: sigma-70 family RNA polymerase sigma factor [Candidatus Limnocylindrales bacterium]